MFAFKLDKPDHIIRTQDTVVKVELSPFEWSSTFGLVAFPSSVLVVNVEFKEEDGEFKFIYEPKNKYAVSDRPTALAISQECVMTPVMNVIQFACATSDFKIHLIEDGLEDKVFEHHEYTGHTMYINDVTFDRVSSADILASVSDDLTCRIWSLKQHECISVLHLSSPGVSVRLGSEGELPKLIVAEKKGLINIYNVASGNLISSFNTFITPLMDMDWSQRDPFTFAVIANDYLFVWDLRRKSSLPVYKEPIFYQGSHIRYSNVNDGVVALITKPLSTLCISKLKTGHVKASVKLPYATNVTWHSRLPYVCVACNKNIAFWKVN